MFAESNSSSAPPLERVLLSLDKGYSAIGLRTAYAFIVTALFDAVFPSASWIGLVAVQILAMFGLRFFGIAFRRGMRFSETTLETWTIRRKLGKYYDSYQWRKVTWIGLGILLYVSLFARARSDFLILAVLCIAAGAIALLTWRRVAADQPKPKPAPRFRKVLLDRTPATAPLVAQTAEQH